MSGTPEGERRGAGSPPQGWPRHVLVTADSVGGVWTYAVQLCRELRATGADVTLAVMGRELSAGQRAEVEAVQGVCLHERAYRLEWMPDCWDDLERAAEWLRSLAAAKPPDIVHLNQFAFGAIAWDRPTVVVGHSCVSSWWEAVHGEPPPGEWDRYREVVGRGLRGADVVVAPSRAMRDALERHYAPIGRTLVVPNALPLRADGSRPRDVSKEPLVLAAGRAWDPAKNLGTLDAAARWLRWPVYVAGEAVAPQEGGGRIALRHARALGQLPAAEVRAWMARAAIYALPARYEPFGLSVLEAAAAGCALVLGDIASLRENWEGAAVFVDPEDAGALAAALEALALDDRARARLAAAARARSARFTPRRFRSSYLAAYAAARDARARRCGAPVPADAW